MPSTKGAIPKKGVASAMGSRKEVGGGFRGAGRSRIRSVCTTAAELGVLSARERRGRGERGKRAARVGVHDGQAERVGGVLARQSRQREQSRHHLLHLFLL